MPVFKRDGTTIYYEVHGDGFPVLTIAPGGLQSSIPRWAALPWAPHDVLSSEYQVIMMDQRNAGKSAGPVSPEYDWQTYTSDQLALLDHLDVNRCHLLGSCIAGSFILRFLETAPERVVSAVMLQPIGASSENRPKFEEMFDDWAKERKASNPELTDSDWATIRGRLFGGDFVFSVTRDFVRTLRTPLLLLMGNDLFHPQGTSREIADIAPNAELVEQWKDSVNVESGKQAVRDFLRKHTP